MNNIVRSILVVGLLYIFLLSSELYAQRGPLHNKFNYLGVYPSMPIEGDFHIKLRDYAGILTLMANIPNNATDANSEELLANYWGSAYFKYNGVIGVNVNKVSLNDHVLNYKKLFNTDYFYETFEGIKDIQFRDPKIKWDVEGENGIPAFYGDSLSQYLEFPSYYYFSHYNDEVSASSRHSDDEVFNALLTLNIKNSASTLRNLTKPDLVSVYITTSDSSGTNLLLTYFGELNNQIAVNYTSPYSMPYFYYPHNDGIPDLPFGTYLKVVRSYKFNEVDVPSAKFSPFMQKWLFVTCVETQVEFRFKE